MDTLLWTFIKVQHNIWRDVEISMVSASSDRWFWT